MPLVPVSQFVSLINSIVTRLVCFKTRQLMLGCNVFVIVGSMVFILKKLILELLIYRTTVYAL